MKVLSIVIELIVLIVVSYFYWRVSPSAPAFWLGIALGANLLFVGKKFFYWLIERIK